MNKNEKVHLLWDFIHNCVIHPALFFSGHRQWVEKLHDWSYQKAWGGDPPRKPSSEM